MTWSLTHGAPKVCEAPHAFRYHRQTLFGGAPQLRVDQRDVDAVLFRALDPALAFARATAADALAVRVAGQRELRPVGRVEAREVHPQLDAAASLLAPGVGRCGFGEDPVGARQ